MKGSVSIVKADSRQEGIWNALELIRNEIEVKMRNRKKILVKPNFVSVKVMLSATPVEAVDVLLSYLYENFSPSEVIMAESLADGTLWDALKNYDYIKLKEKYPIEFIYLDEDEFETIEVFNSKGEKFNIRLAKIALNENLFKISICRPKTHDTVIVTLTIKNMAMGVIPRREKPLMHQGYHYINLNIAKVAAKVMPDLGVIDGLEGMQGNGPVHGEPIKWGAFLASTNPLHLDSLTAYMMGFNPQDIGYLHYLHKWGYGEINPTKIPWKGENPEKLKAEFKPHKTFHKQLKWETNLII